MSNPESNANANIKQVMRTALVGVSPADKVMLKGYLRILLRLEADLEWVSANHPQADLLFINNEFRSAASVQNLLKSSPNKAVLFVEKSANSNGSLQGDTLTLPLNELSILSDWLMTRVPILNGGQTGSGTSQSARTEIDRSIPPLSADKPPQTTASVSQPVADDTASQQTASVSSPVSVKANATQLLDFLKVIGERRTGVYALQVGGQRIAVIEPQKGRVWTTTQPSGIDGSWQLQKLDESTPTESARDLFQWLWQVGMKNPDALMPYINDAVSYQLRYWPKPVNQSTRRDVLKVLTALETEPRTVNQVSALAEVSVNSVKKVLASLLLAGGLPHANYADLSTNIQQKSQAVEDKPESETPVTAPEPPKPTQPKSTGSALDDALARRAAGQTSSQPVSSTVEIDLSGGTVTQRPTSNRSDAANSVNPQSSNQANQEKRGFLSRLRQKLGL